MCLMNIKMAGVARTEILKSRVRRSWRDNRDKVMECLVDHDK